MLILQENYQAIVKKNAAARLSIPPVRPACPAACFQYNMNLIPEIIWITVQDAGFPKVDSQ